MVVFLYCEPGHADTRDRLQVATRIFLAGDDVADLRRIVSQLYALSNEYRAMGRFDPRDQLSTVSNGCRERTVPRLRRSDGRSL